MKTTRVPYMDREINLFELNLKENVADVLRYLRNDPSLDDNFDYEAEKNKRCWQCGANEYDGECKDCFIYEHWFTAFAIKSGNKMIIVHNVVSDCRIENFDTEDTLIEVSEQIYRALEGGRKVIEIR